ncbi:MAG: response regulator transcription factor [Saprospiraceae bacterium]|nr:response regulator transcription factor [Saprospiraceae bacterium]
MARLLLVEDEVALNDMIKLNLELEGYEVISCDHGKKALEIFPSQHFDLVILDIMLPDLDGFQICEQIRLSDQKTPIIFLTAKDHPKDRIKGLKIGGDDYINKPFELEELLLRIHNVLKRTSSEVESAITKFDFGEFWIDFQDFKAKTLLGDIDLSKTEVMLLKLLIDRRNQVVSRQEILQAVWGYDIFPSTRTIDNFILSFRKYFERNPKDPSYFKSVRGVGYKFEFKD